MNRIQIRLLVLLASLQACTLAVTNPSAGGSRDKGPLLAFKAGITSDPTGALANWSPLADSPCNWTGVVCDAASSRVVALNLSRRRLRGVLSPAEQPLGDLRLLHTLQLAANELSGPIPGSLAAASNLRTLDLGGNRFSGPLPAGLGSLSSLQVLDVHSNNLSGTIPDDFKYLRNLTVLSLFDNRLTGALLPALSRLKMLTVLHISANRLQGGLPAKLGELPRLRSLLLNDNNLTGNIPASWGGLSVLLQLSLSNNNLQGPLPPTLGDLSRLQTLSLNSNRINGTLPPALGSLRSLQRLDLSANQLTGGIPSSLDSLTRLQALDLSANRLQGVVPTTGVLGKFPEASYAGNPSLCYHTCRAVPSTPPSTPPALAPPVLSPPRRLLLPPPPLVKYPPPVTSPPTVPAPAPAPTQAPAPAPAPRGEFVATGRSTKWHRAAMATLVVACVGAALLLGLCLSLLCCSRGVACARICDSGEFLATTAAHKRAGGSAGGGGGNQALVCMFDEKPIRAEDMLAATSQLAPEKEIHSGSLGTTYKATFPDGTILAVKWLQFGGQLRHSFELDVRRLGQVRSPYVLPLLGFWCGEDGTALVYPHMPRGTLREFLHSDSKKKSKRSQQWGARFKIAVATARGVAYLHTGMSPALVHRNLQPSCILLDAFYEAHIADAGIAPLILNSADIHSSAESLAYVAPEYSHVPRATESADVYSLGVVLLELLTGRRPHEEVEMGGVPVSMLAWVRANALNGEAPLVLDPKVDRAAKEEEMLAVLKVALLCAGEDAAARPSAKEVVEMLIKARGDAAQSRRGTPRQSLQQGAAADDNETAAE